VALVWPAGAARSLALLLCCLSHRHLPRSAPLETATSTTMAVRSLLKTLALLLVALLFLSVVVAATDEPAAAAADTPEPAAAAEADHDEAATPKPKPPPLVLPALKPQKELPKRFVFTEVEGELGTRHFEGAYLLPKKAGKVTVSFNSPRRVRQTYHHHSDRVRVSRLC